MYAIIGPTGLLLYVGFAPLNVDGYQSIPVDDGFTLEPGKWMYINGEFVPYDGPLPSAVIEKPAEA